MGWLLVLAIVVDPLAIPASMLSFFVLRWHCYCYCYCYCGKVIPATVAAGLVQILCYYCCCYCWWCFVSAEKWIWSCHHSTNEMTLPAALPLDSSFLLLRMVWLLVCFRSIQSRWEMVCMVWYGMIINTKLIVRNAWLFQISCNISALLMLILMLMLRVWYAAECWWYAEGVWSCTWNTWKLNLYMHKLLCLSVAMACPLQWMIFYCYT